MYFCRKNNFSPVGTTLIIACFLIISLLISCAPRVKKPLPSIPYPQPVYRIQPGDVLDIKFFYNPELNEKIPVRPDGLVSLHLAHEVIAADRTPAELTDTLMKMYRTEFKQVKITVIVRSFSSQKIYVTGAVQKSTEIILQGKLTVLQAVALAGGFQNSARIDTVVVIRRVSDSQPQVIHLNLEKVIDGTDTNQDILLSPMDVIYVQKKMKGR